MRLNIKNLPNLFNSLVVSHVTTNLFLVMKKINPLLKLCFMLFFTNLCFGQAYYPGGDTCATAIPIPVGDGFFTLPDGDPGDNWYSFIAPCDGDLTISDVGESAAGKRIYSGDDCDSLIVEVVGTWDTADLTYSMFAGQEILVAINDSWDGESEWDMEFDTCVVDSAHLDISGTVYYDSNNNGIQDPGELGKFLNIINSDPTGIFTVTGVDGFYYSSIADLDDGTYEIYPELDDYWEISSDSLTYTVVVGPGFEQMDSLDFGIHPDTLIYEVDADLTGAFPRCNDTINYWINLHNVGTTIAEGLIHLEIDDSLHYVTADVLPDSVVGQNLYWNYESLFYNEYDLIAVQLGTPDGLEDTVSSTLIVTVDSMGVEKYSTTIVEEQVITCAYDPNDKTPTPLGEGEFGYIDPETESIEYLIRFQNTGTDTAFTVVIKDQLDENLDWYSIDVLGYSHYMNFELSADGEVSFIFDNIMLPDSNVNEVASHGFVKYRIDLKPDLPLGTSIFNTAEIYFDLNPAVITNTTINTLHIDDVGIDELTDGEQLLVYPNPSNESTTIYTGKDMNGHSIKIVDLLGKEVYFNNGLSGVQLKVQTEQFKPGVYVVLLVDDMSNEIVSSAKLTVN